MRPRHGEGKAPLMDGEEEQRDGNSEAWTGDSGAIPESRPITPVRDPALAIGLTAVVGVSALALIARNPPSLIPLYFVVLLLAPLTALALMRLWPESYGIFPLNGVFRRRFLVPRTDPRNDLFPMLLMASSGLFVCGVMGPTRMGNLLSVAPLLLWAAPLATVQLVGFLSANVRNPNLGNAVVTLVLLCAVHPFGAVTMINTQADRSVPQRFAVQVTGHHIDHGDGRVPMVRYFLDLAADPPFTRPRRSVWVSETMYRYANQYGWACVKLHAGALHVSWFEPIDCATGP